MTKKKGRTIPKAVSDEVKERHFFECAWCGVNITERHHIAEYSQGGEHTIDNLILLCPTCHTSVHKKEIPHEELIKRKSNHRKCDRLMGNFKTTLDKSKIVIGTDTLIDCRHLIAIDRVSVLDIIVEKGNLFLFCVFFDPKGNLIFWMNDNYYWTEVDAIVSPPKIDFLEISNPDDLFYLKIEKIKDYLKIDIKMYLFGNLFYTFPQGLAYTNGNYHIASHYSLFRKCEGCYHLPLLPNKN